MSQVKKKLQAGGNAPKQKYGKLRIDSREYEATPEMMQALGSYISGLDPKHQRFLGDVEEALRSGKDVSLNTHTNRLTGLSGFSELNDSQNRRSREGRTHLGKFIGAITDSDVNQSNEAIALLGRFSYAQPAIASQSSKTKINNDVLDFDYDTDENGNTKYSVNPKNKYIQDRFKYYYDWFEEPDTWKDVYEWSKAPENEAILRSWYENLSQDPTARRQIAENVINEALAKVAASKSWDEVPEDVRELLGYFNIGNETASTQTIPTATVKRDSWRDENGNVAAGSKNENGSYRVWKGNSKQNANELDDAYYTSAQLGLNTPYMITEGDWDSLGLIDDLEGLRNGIIYGGRIYTPEQISALTTGDLYNAMQRVQAYNADRTLSGADRWKAIGEVLDWADETGGYNGYDYNSKNQFIKNKALRELLKDRNNLSFFNAAGKWGFEDGELLGFYDYSQDTTNPYGFRAPTYIFFDEDGTPTLYNAEELAVAFPANKYNRYGRYNPLNEATYFSNQRVNTKQGQMWVYGEAQNGNDPEHPWRILVDAAGNLWIEDGRGNLITVTPELLEKINNGEPITRQEALTGNSSSKRTKPSAVTGGISSSATANAMEAAAKAGVLTRKDGGKMSYIAKLQYGSGIPIYIPSGETVADYHNPSQDAGLIRKDDKFDFSGLDENDRRDLYAAALDLSGAIAGLIPGGSVVGAGMGLTSTGMMLKSDYERGRLDSRAIGNAALATLLDAASIIPYVGETAKVAKIARNISRIGRVAAPIFNAAGLTAAYKAITKDPKTWNTEDAMAVSAGLQAILNIGHTKVRGAQDARVAAAIRETKSTRTTTAATEPVHQRKQMQLAEGEHANAGTKQDVTLDAGEVTRVTAAKEKAGEELRKILKDNHHVAETEFSNANDKALLESFGFKVKEKGITAGKNRHDIESVESPKVETTRAGVPKGENFQKRGYLTDLFKGANRRTEFIDKNIGDAAVRQSIEQRLAPESTEGGLDKRLLEKGYRRALMREALPDIENLPFNERTQKRLMEAVEARRQNRQSQQAEQAAQQESAPEQQAPAQQTTQQTPVSPQPAVNPESTVTPEVAAQRELKAYVEPRMIDIRERGKVRRSERRQKQLAANIKALQESSDPMKTLSEISARTKDFDEQVFANQEEFQAALNYALSRMPKGKGSGGDKKYKDYLAELSGFLDRNNLVVFTKKGGIIKAQNGLSLYPNGLAPQIKKRSVQLPFFTSTEISAPKPIAIPAYKNPYSGEETNMFTGEQVAKPTWQRTSLSPAYDDSTDTLGHWNINAKIGHNAIEQGLGWYQYFRDLRDQKKYEQNQIKALNASRVQDQAARANHFTYDNPAFDRAEANLRNENIRGFKAITSDVNAYNAQQQSALGKLLDAQQKLTAQRSAADAQINMQNAEIDRQNAMNEVATANQNRRTNAAIDAAIFNAKNERILREQQSRQNKILEIRNNLANDRKLMSQMNLSGLSEEEQYKLNSEIDKLFPNARLEYENLPDGQTEYASFEDYIAKKYPELWKQNASRLRELNTAAQNRMRQAGLTMQLNYPSLMGLAQSNSIGAYKKGGYLRGSTRYTKEPDEQIWIDNNKAAHRAVAKLEDNIIKLLLRALK